MTRTSLTEVTELLANLERTERLEALVAFGEELPELSVNAREDRDLGRHIIHECQSPVYFRALLRDGRVFIDADVPREAPIARGFVGMLLAVFDGVAVASITSANPGAPADLLRLTKLDEALTLQRQRGLSAIYAALLSAATKATPVADTTAHTVSAIVLAAGMSSRMPRKNKLLINIRGKPMVAHVVDALLENINDHASKISHAVLVLGFEANRVRGVLLSDVDVAEAVTRRRLSITINEEYAEGQASSVRAGVYAAGLHEDKSSSATQPSGLMFCLADMPDITAAEYRHIANAFCDAVTVDPNAIAVPYHDKARGNPVVLSSTFRRDMWSLRGDSGCRPIIEHNPAHVSRIVMSTDNVLRDVDSPDALRLRA